MKSHPNASQKQTTKMKTAVATFAYPAPDIEIYAKDCLRSLANQTDRDFSLFAFNDGLSTLAQIVVDSGIPTAIVPTTGNPADIRRNAIRHLTELGFDIIVFADIDDLFDAKRVQISKEMIGNGVDVVVNELILFGQGYSKPYHMLEGRVNEGNRLTKKDIESGNCFGMSNTSIRASAITNKSLEPHLLAAFDWFFYTNILADGAFAQFTANTHTLYRQHANNIAPIRHMDDADILRGLKIKQQHFDAMNDSYAQELAVTFNIVNRDDLQKQKYCSAVRSAMPPQPFWWEAIKTFKELEL